MGEAWGGHLSVGLDAGRQPQNRPTTAALARLERSRRAGIIARTPGTTSMPLASSIGRRGQKLVIAKLGLRLRAWCIRRVGVLWEAFRAGISQGASSARGSPEGAGWAGILGGSAGIS